MFGMTSGRIYPAEKRSGILQRPVCKHGYLRGSETFNYVREVMERYNYYLTKTGQKG